MHFRTMLFVDLPEVKPDPQREQCVLSQLEALRAKQPGKIAESVLMECYTQRLTNVMTAFGYELVDVVDSAMERFYCNTENPEYLEFEDRTEEYQKDYEKSVDCVVMPGGKIMELGAYPIWRKFIIKDGLVYQRVAGQLKHPKRTKKAKKMKALPNYPKKKLYPSFDAFVEDCGGRRNEETGQYGEWFNPDSVYDWFSIGGRWPAMFLVKTDCTEYTLGERRFMDDSEYPAPEGYRWVAGARKRDIQWDAMRQWRNQQAEERFRQLEQMFQSGQIDFTVHHITDDGIYAWGEQVYHKDQTLEEYMSKYGIPESWKYPISVCGIFIGDTYHNDYDSVYDEELRKCAHLNWQEAMDNHIDNADDNTVFVGIDYHM